MKRRGEGRGHGGVINCRWKERKEGEITDEMRIIAGRKRKEVQRLMRQEYSLSSLTIGYSSIYGR